MKVINSSDPETWNTIIRQFPAWDIYYLCEYAISMKKHGDGDPILLYFSDADMTMCYVVMKQDIYGFGIYSKFISENTYYDLITPYGYGGPLYNGIINQVSLKYFFDELTDYCMANNIVSQFIRFHPLIQNEKAVINFINTKYLKKTVYIDTTSEETIWNNMDSKNRNLIRKAVKNNIHIEIDDGKNIDDFIAIYESTMVRNNASKYYYFDRDYFDYIIKHLSQNTIFLHAIHEGKIISSSIFFYNDSYMHYHLSGTLFEYKNFAAANLLLHEAAKWAAGMNIKALHLGGGFDIDDSLLHFKKQFNRDGLIDFCIGSTIFNDDLYKRLIEIRVQNDTTYDAQCSRMIKYRG